MSQNAAVLALNRIPDVPDNLDFAMHDFLEKMKNGLDAFLDVTGSLDNYVTYTDIVDVNDHGELEGLSDDDHSQNRSILEWIDA